MVILAGLKLVANGIQVLFCIVRRLGWVRVFAKSRREEVISECG